MPMIIAAIAVVGAATLSGIGAAQQADAAQKAAAYNAQVASNNATIDAQNRSSTLQQGEMDTQTAMRKQAQMIGAQRAQMSANGLDITQGSAQDMLASTKFLGGIDVNTIQSNAARQAWGYSIQGMNDQNAATMETWKANSINPAAIGAMAAGGSLLSAAGGAFASSSANGNGYQMGGGGGGGGDGGGGGGGG